MGEEVLEHPIREGWLWKQSGGAVSGGGKKRRSMGELLSKWDDRYFVMSCNKLYYFKSKADFKGGAAAKGVIVIQDHVAMINKADPTTPQFRLRGKDRIYNFKAENKPIAERWLVAVRATQLAAMAEYNSKQLATFLSLLGLNKAVGKTLEDKGIAGSVLGKCKSIEDVKNLIPNITEEDADKIWDYVSNLKNPTVRSWLERFSAFCQRNAAIRSLTPPELQCLVKLTKGLEIFGDTKADVNVSTSGGASDTFEEEQDELGAVTDEV